MVCQHEPRAQADRAESGITQRVSMSFEYNHWAELLRYWQIAAFSRPDRARSFRGASSSGGSARRAQRSPLFRRRGSVHKESSVVAIAVLDP